MGKGHWVSGGTIMENWERSIPIFERLGFLYGSLEPEFFNKIKESCFDAKKTRQPVPHELAGHIKEEYPLKDTLDEETLQYIYSVLCNSHLTSDEANPRVKNLNAALQFKPNKCGFEFRLGNVWANFQKKHEFNPIHFHCGLISFIIFVQIPYDVKKEEGLFVTANEASYSSCLGFLSSKNDGSIEQNIIQADTSFIGRIIAFPAQLQHFVYPFYTSDDYRITVSGNVEGRVFYD